MTNAEAKIWDYQAAIEDAKRRCIENDERWGAHYEYVIGDAHGTPITAEISVERTGEDSARFEMAEFSPTPHAVIGEMQDHFPGFNERLWSTYQDYFQLSFVEACDDLGFSLDGPDMLQHVRGSTAKGFTFTQSHGDQAYWFDSDEARDECEAAMIERLRAAYEHHEETRSVEEWKTLLLDHLEGASLFDPDRPHREPANEREAEGFIWLLLLDGGHLENLSGEEIIEHNHFEGVVDANTYDNIIRRIDEKLEGFNARPYRWIKRGNDIGEAMKEAICEALDGQLEGEDYHAWYFGGQWGDDSYGGFATDNVANLLEAIRQLGFDRFGNLAPSPERGIGAFNRITVNWY